MPSTSNISDDVPHRPRAVIVVDAYSSGSLYAGALRARGYVAVHVQSTDSIPVDDRRAFVPHDYVSNYVFDGDLPRLVRTLTSYRPHGVLAGSEQSVVLADQLSEALGLASNGAAFSTARRDKFEMQRAIAAAGLRSIPSRVASRWEEVASWVVEHLPVVVKPRASAGTDHVFLCATESRAREAFHTIVGRADVFGVRNETVLLQQAIEGVEYNVNFVSRDGVHCVTDLWRIDKVRGERPLYDRGVVLARHGTVQDAMVDYVAAVLDVLGIRMGPSHADVMWTDTGPVLIEVGARLHGQKVQLLCEAGTGVSQVEVALDAYLAPKRFLAQAALDYELRRHLQRVELIAPRGGVLRAWRGLDEVRALPSFYAMQRFVEANDPIAATTDLMSVPGFVDLLHEDPAVVERDYERLRAMERDVLYDIDATTAPGP